MLVLSSALAAPALAQRPPPPHHRSHRVHPEQHRHRPQEHRESRRERGTPEDRGPFTPEANRAYNGGGAILQGEPGGRRPPESEVLPR